MERQKNPLYDVAVCEVHGRQNNFYDKDGTIKCAGCCPVWYELETQFDTIGAEGDIPGSKAAPRRRTG